MKLIQKYKNKVCITASTHTHTHTQTSQDMPTNTELFERV